MNKTLRTFSVLTLCVSVSSVASANNGNNILRNLANPSSAARTTLGMSQLQSAQNRLMQVHAIQELLEDSNNQLQPLRINHAHGVGTVRFQHYYEGLEVVGSQALVHESNGLDQITNATSGFILNPNPTLSLRDAVALAEGLHPNSTLSKTPVLKVLPELKNNTAHLVYFIEVDVRESNESFEVLLDAHSGDLIADTSLLQTIAPIDIYDATHAPDDYVSPQGTPIKFDLEGFEQVVQDNKRLTDVDASAEQAFLNAGSVLNYYFGSHEQDSYDGQGSEIVSVVHVGRHYANAFWHRSRKIMGYGDGDGRVTQDFTQAVDVAGHEMTHGIVSETAQLLGYGDHGALNEALADIFGEIVEGKQDWVMGRDLFIDQTLGHNGIRNIIEPGVRSTRFQNPDGSIERRPYPKHMSEKLPSNEPCTRLNDRCWVHVNSTIFSHAAYQMIQKIGQEQAEKLLFTTMTQYLTPSSDFESAKTSVLQACDILFPAQTCERVTEAFAMVGL